MSIFNRNAPSGTAPVINASAPGGSGNNMPNKPAEPVHAPATPAAPQTGKPVETTKA